MKVVSSNASANDTVSFLGCTFKGGLTASLGGSTASNVVSLVGVTVGTNLSVTGKGDVDNVDLVNLLVGGKVVLNLGDGANTMDLLGFVNIAKALSYTGTNGVDDIDAPMDELFVGGNTTFNLGNEANNVQILPTDFAVFSRNLSITSGINDDTVGAASFRIGGNATFKLGNNTGTQSLALALGDASVVSGNLSITGGSGVDDVTVQEMTVRGATTIKLLAGNDELTIDDSTFMGTAFFDGSSGEDDFFIENGIGLAAFTNFGGKLKVLGGADNDNLSLGNGNNAATVLIVNGASTTFDGGLGNNSFNDALGLVFVNGTLPKQLNGF